MIYIRKGRGGGESNAARAKDKSDLYQEGEGGCVSQMLLEQKTRVIYIRKGRGGGGESNAARAKDKSDLYQEGEGGVSQMLL